MYVDDDCSRHPFRFLVRWRLPPWAGNSPIKSWRGLIRLLLYLGSIFPFPVLNAHNGNRSIWDLLLYAHACATYFTVRLCGETNLLDGPLIFNFQWDRPRRKNWLWTSVFPALQNKTMVALPNDSQWYGHFFSSHLYPASATKLPVVMLNLKGTIARPISVGMFLFGRRSHGKGSPIHNSQ
jgi:hypothetical protein